MTAPIFIRGSSPPTWYSLVNNRTSTWSTPESISPPRRSRVETEKLLDVRDLMKSYSVSTGGVSSSKTPTLSGGKKKLAPEGGGDIGNRRRIRLRENHPRANVAAAHRAGFR